MTTPKLTPAEALAALRSRYDSDRTYEPWARILEEFGDGDAGKFASECWSVLESALARLAALEAKPRPVVHVEGGRIAGATGDVILDGGYVAPEPVPSDEEIREQMMLVGRLTDEEVHPLVFRMFRLLAKRIGVKL